MGGRPRPTGRAGVIELGSEFSSVVESIWLNSSPGARGMMIPVSSFAMSASLQSVICMDQECTH